MITTGKVYKLKGKKEFVLVKQLLPVGSCRTGKRGETIKEPVVRVWGYLINCPCTFNTSTSRHWKGEASKLCKNPIPAKITTNVTVEFKETKQKKKAGKKK